MTLTYQLDQSGALVRGRASGNVTERQVIEAIDKVVSNTAGRALHVNALTFLADGTSLDQFDAPALKRIHAHILTWLVVYPGLDIKSAFVTGDPANASVLRLWKALVDLNPTIGRHVRVFAAEADALAWLSQARL